MLSLVAVGRQMLGKFRWKVASLHHPKRDRTILELGMLEDRTVPANFRWNPAGMGPWPWNNGANWFNETLNQQNQGIPGAGDTAKFTGQAQGEVQVPDGTTVSTLKLETGTGITLKLAGTLLVDTELEQYAGIINDGVLSLLGSRYL